jgi:hypothetical protein
MQCGQLAPAANRSNAPLLYTLLILFVVKLKILQPIKDYFSAR